MEERRPDASALNMTAISERPRVPFAEGKRSAQFGRALIEKLQRRVGELRDGLVPPENVSNFPHGHGWTFQQQHEERFVPETAEFEKHSTNISVHDERILAHDLMLLEELILSLSSQIHEQLIKTLLQQMDEACTRSGRVTNIAKGASLADGVLDVLADIQASVDSHGNVSFPQMMLTPDLIERLQSELVTRGKELEQRAAEIRAKAEQDAKEREAKRLARYQR